MSHAATTAERSAPAARPGAAETRPARLAIVLNSVLVVLLSVPIVSMAYRSRTAVTNIDGVSYMGIARQYAHGDFVDAVNAYWSPMVSWVMAPFIRGGLGLTSSFAAANTVACVAILVVGAWLVLSVTKSGWATAFASVATAPVLLANVARQTPDLLVLLWFVAFLWLMLVADRSRHGSRSRRLVVGSALGALCALGFFAKLFLVPVFLVVVPLWFGFRWWRTDHRDRGALGRSAVLVLTALVALVVVAAPWVVALSVKYHTVTAGSSLVVNTESKFTDTANGPGDDYVLPVPPNTSAFSPAEDRTPSVFEGRSLTAERTTPVSGRSAASDDDRRKTSATTTLAGKLTYYVSQRVEALPYYQLRISSFAPFATWIGVLFAVGVLLRFIDTRRHALATVAAVATGVYWLGYAGIATVDSFGGNARYYLPLFSGTVIVLACLLPDVWGRIRSGGLVRRVVVVVGCLLVVTASVTQNAVGIAAPFSSVDGGSIGAPPLQVFAGTYEPKEPLVEALHERRALPVDSRIAGSNARAVVQLAFRFDAHAYGTDSQQYDIDDPSFVDLLHRAGVQYWLQFTPEDATPPDLSRVGTVTHEVVVDTACDDVKAADVEPCRIQVVSLGR
jgi:hypothetical protein